MAGLFSSDVTINNYKDLKFIFVSKKNLYLRFITGNMGLKAKYLKF